MSETIGLSIAVDGDITQAKRKIDELARYADQTMSRSFSSALGSRLQGGPIYRPGAAGVPSGISSDLPRQIEVAIRKGFADAIPSLASSISSAVSGAIRSSPLNVNVGGGGVGPPIPPGQGTSSPVTRQRRTITRAAEEFIRDAKIMSLQDNFFGNSGSVDQLQQRFDHLRQRVQGLAREYQQMDATSTAGARRRADSLSHMYDQLTRVESLMTRINKKYRDGSFVYDPVHGSLVQGPSSEEARRSAQISRTEINRNARASGVAISRISGDGLQYVALQDFQSAANRRRRSMPEAADPEIAPQQGWFGRMRDYALGPLGFGSSGMANTPKNNRSTQYGYQSGLFRDKAVGGLFTIQQAIEDYSYAGLRGAANNIAFMAASIGGKTGLATVAALAAYQLYEMGKAAGWWGQAAKLAEERTARVTASIKAMGEATAQARYQSAYAAESVQDKFSSAFMTPGGSRYASNRSDAITRMVGTFHGQRLVNAMAMDIQSRPMAYAGIAPGTAGLESSYVAMQAAKADADRKRNALRILGKSSMIKGLGNDQRSISRLYDVASVFGSAGSDYVDEIRKGMVGGATNESLKKAVADAEQAAKDAVAKNDEAIKNLGLTASSTAKEILSLIGNNSRAADSVEAVIRKNQTLNFEYERQKKILREKAVLEDRSGFQSQGFDLMRSKGRQYLEQMGAPEAYIQRRELALYERQGSMLFGMAGASEKAGDMQGRIKYLKELQQLQMQLAGGSDNRFISEKAFSAAIYTQSLIENSIRKTEEGSNQEYQMIQQLASGVAGVRDMILTMPKIDLGLDRQNALAIQLEQTLIRMGARVGQSALNQFMPGPGFVPNTSKASGLATGGHIPGYGGGDRVPAMLEQGEFVVRKEAVKALGKEYLHNVVNQAHAKKFASGGYVTGYHSDYRYRGSRRMSNYGTSYYRDGRLRPRHSVAARESVDEWKAMYGTDTYRERLMNSEFGPKPATAESAFASIPSEGSNVGSVKVKVPWMESGFLPPDREDYWQKRESAKMRAAGIKPITGREPHKPFVLSGDNWLKVHRKGNFGEAVSSVYGRRIGSVGTSIDPLSTFSMWGVRNAQRERWADAGIVPLTGRESHSRLGFGTSGSYSNPTPKPLSGARLALSNQRAQFSFAMQRRRDAYQAEMANRRSLGWRGLKAQRGAFGNYANTLFGQGGTPYQGGPGWGMSPEQMMMAQEMMARQNNVARSIAMMGPWANRSFGLWDQGSYGIGGNYNTQAVNGYFYGGRAFKNFGFRGFAKGGFVDPYGGTLVATDPNILQEGSPWQYQGFIPWNSGWGLNDAAFQDQRNRVLAGSLNAAYGGPTDFAGNTLGSFGRFSDGSFKSRYSGGFGSGMGGGGFSSIGRGGHFSSFGRPIGAMTGGYVAGVQHIQKFASGGLVNATQARDVSKALSGMGTGSSVHNNFGNVTIRVETPRDALDTVNGMRRSQASFWARRG